MIKLVFIAASLCALAGCSTIPKDAYLLTPSNLEDRRLESRIFANIDETALLKDCSIILKNMGYSMDLMNPDIGLLTATKYEERRGAAAMFMTVLSAGLASTDKEQAYKATFTTMPAQDRRGAYLTRLTLQRIVFNSDDEATSVELIKDPDLYKLFYERLEASTFVEPDRL
jgi:hypothetical protein